MMNNAVLWSALQLGTVVVVHPARARHHRSSSGSLYIMNVGLDEVFNPKLRKM